MFCLMSICLASSYPQRLAGSAKKKIKNQKQKEEEVGISLYNLATLARFVCFFSSCPNFSFGLAETKTKQVHFQQHWRSKVSLQIFSELLRVSQVVSRPFGAEGICGLFKSGDESGWRSGSGLDYGERWLTFQLLKQLEVEHELIVVFVLLYICMISMATM